VLLCVHPRRINGGGLVLPVLLISLGFVSWSLIEYGLHRFVFHYEARSRLGQKLLYHAHVAHHENPEGNTRHFASLLLSTPVAVVYWLMAWAATGSWAVATYLFIGMASGYLTYQWLHFQCHHRKSRVRVLRYLRKYHLLHHYRTPELRFGVTSPLFDLVFGTFRPVVRARLRPNLSANIAATPPANIADRRLAGSDHLV
jgi:dihydroceramide fatty acyl 2-hydroxylase